MERNDHNFAKTLAAVLSDAADRIYTQMNRSDGESDLHICAYVGMYGYVNMHAPSRIPFIKITEAFQDFDIKAGQCNVIEAKILAVLQRLLTGNPTLIALDAIFSESRKIIDSEICNRPDIDFEQAGLVACRALGEIEYKVYAIVQGLLGDAT